MAFIKLGKKIKDTCGPAEVSKGPKIMFPSFYIDNVKLPIKGAGIGKVLMANVKLKITSIEERSDERGEHRDYRFDVLGIEFSGKKKLDISNLSAGDLDVLEQKEFEGLGK